MAFVQLSKIREAMDQCVQDWPKFKTVKFKYPGMQERFKEKEEGEL